MPQELIKRFQIVPIEYGSQQNYYHCNTKRTWQTYLNSYFRSHLNERQISFNKTVSNASFRISGLELKIGILLADDEARVGRNQTLSGAVKPSIVIDVVLSTFSILEGLTMLSFVSSLTPDKQSEIISKENRGDKISKGLQAATGSPHKSKVKKLRELRDRCIHQDHADLKEGLDYEHIFETAAIRPHVELLYNYLKSLETEENQLPDTNLREFWSLDYPTTS